jgi:cellulose biosynthesis protein BcsQ
MHRTGPPPPPGQRRRSHSRACAWPCAPPREVSARRRQPPTWPSPSPVGVGSWPWTPIRRTVSAARSGSSPRVSVQLAGTGGLVTSIRRGLRPLLDEYDHILLDTRGDLGGLTLAAVCAADTVLTVFTSDPGSALGVVRVAAFLEQHRTYENTSAVLLGVACVAWDKEGRAAREVLGALEGTGLPLLETRVPMSRRVPTSALAKRPVVLSAPSSPVACAYLALADEVLTLAERLHR